MKYYIISIIAIIAILYISSCNVCGKENFTSNVVFSDLPSVIMNSTNMKKIEIKNPGQSKYALVQNKFDKVGYKIAYNVKPNKKYLVSYWRTNDQFYDGNNFDIKIVANDIVLSKNGKVVGMKEKDNLGWKQINYVIDTKNITKIIIELGSVGYFTNGKRYFADLQIEEILPKISNFKYKKNLALFLKLNSKKIKQQKVFTDIVSQKKIKFGKELNMNSYGANLNKTKGELQNDSIVIAKNSTIFFVYTAEENQNGSLLYIPANNDYNMGINIDIQSNIGSDNRLSITIVDKNFIYDIGLIQNPIIFSLLIEDKVHRLLINGKEVKPLITNDLSRKTELGTCPDSWMYIGNNKCKSMNNNKGSCDPEIDISNVKDKNSWSANCKAQWTNCKTLNTGEIAPGNAISCEIDNEISYSNKPILLNKDGSLTGRLHSLIIYNGNLDSKTLVNIYNYLARQLLNLDFKDNICNRPNLYKKSTTYIVPPPNEFKAQINCCPFNDKNVCKDNCAGVNWKDSKEFATINKECKNNVNEYCRKNFDDQYCNLLRNNKIKVREGIRVSEKSKLKAQIENNCNNCDSKVDLSKYIKKDKVPCWGCSIDKIKNL